MILRRVLSAALLLPLVPALLLAEPLSNVPASPPPAPAAQVGAESAAATPTDFVRFVEDTEGARLQTGVATYRNSKGVRVTLIGAVHVGDEAYYKALNEKFRNYDAVLYEMVGGPIEKREERMAEAEAAAAAPATPKSNSEGQKSQPKDADALTVPTDAPSTEGDNFAWLHGLHATLQKTLELQGQLDGIDYHQPNLVHADMSLEQFSKMQEKQNEGFLALWLKAVQVQMNQPQSSAQQPGMLKILEILCSPNSATELKRMIGRTFDTVESLITGLEKGGGTVIVSGRNQVALKVMDREIARGRRELAIFYGAAHLPDLETRLLDKGFTLEETGWVTAWDLPPPPPAPAPASAPGAPAAGKPAEPRQNP